MATAEPKPGTRYNVGTYPLHIDVLDMYQLNYQQPPHWQADLEFYLVIAGTAAVYVNGVWQQLQQGTGLVVNSRRLHYLSAERGTTARVATVLVNPELLAASTTDAGAELRQHSASSSQDYLYLEKQTPWQATILRRLSLLANYHRYGGSDPLSAYTDALALCARTVGHFARNVRPEVAADASQTAAVWQMVDYVDRNFATDIAVSDIARAGRVGRSQCYDLFAKVLDVSPNALLLQKRLEYATALLRGTELDMATVAQRAGFNDASYFARVFKRQFGQTPRAYRVAARS
ncbi:AraC family transcriptional regulator [Lacticaseibacillus zhaodongensis]|uniref:AraC family transcriptional regulator n=1 Tax=Lacticaseibacillus zhaodongensis TaxID=2668065 RepID=UPI0012D35998|nr:AraC family transcriptional regulator [Lacticaseibacillus zhaodongensis]